MTYYFKIQLREVIMPPVWRRLKVKSDISFQEFHQIIHEAFGWFENSEYYFESKKNITYGINFSEMILSDYFSDDTKMLIHHYNLSDKWEHAIFLDKITDEKMSFPELIAGKGACPVEGCGGVWAYERVKKFLRNPDSDEWHEVMIELYGHLAEENFDPEFFDFEITAQNLKKIKFN